MTGVYAPFIYAGGGLWLKHHLLLLDEGGRLLSLTPFQGETERTIAYSGILLPAFPDTVAGTPEETLKWLTDRLSAEEGVTLKDILERVFPHLVLIPGQTVRLWNLQDLLPDAQHIGSEAVLRSLYP